MVDLRAKVKALCKLQGITQKELAKKIDISEVALNVSLRPDSNPAIKTIDKIANGLGVSLYELLRDESEQPEVLHTPFARCPHCGGKIELYIKAVGDEKKPD
jgi:transcriptional regulator with XRE-family HTH domain